MKDATYWIQRLKLVEHPDGGFYRETYRSADTLHQNGLPARFPGPRQASTAIYYLLRGSEHTLFHRLRSDEMWHFYAGGSLTLHVLSPQGEALQRRLGRDFEAGERFQVVIPAGHWFAAAPDDPASYTLAGVTVAPGFDFDDVEPAARVALLAAFPQHAPLIEAFTAQV